MPQDCEVILREGTLVCVNGVPLTLRNNTVAYVNVEDVARMFQPHAPEQGTEQTACPKCPGKEPEPHGTSDATTRGGCGIKGCSVCDPGVRVFSAEDIERAVSADVKPLFARRPLVERLKQRLIDDAVDNGADPVQAAQVVADLVGERPLLDRLADIGWEKLLKLLLELLKVLR
jgi:hypothetical protein